MEWLTESLTGLLVALYSLMQIRYWQMRFRYRARIRAIEKYADTLGEACAE